MSQFQCDRSPSQAGYHRRLGGLLPHQLANGPQAHPQAEQLLLSSKPHRARTLCGITPCFHGLFPTQGQITYVLLTRSPLSPTPKGRFPSDLHA